MPCTKKKSQKKRNSRTNQTVKKKASQKSSRSSNIVTKSFEIFVTDFLIDPCGLPVELKDCVLVDGAASLNNSTDNSSSNNYQVLKKIFDNNEALMINSVPLIVNDSSKKVVDSDHRMII